MRDERSRQRGLALLCKQAFDRCMGGLLFVATAPVALTAIALTRATIGAPALFSQVRPGRGGRPFTILKIRTMCDAFDVDGKPLPDDQRVTRLGRFLRATSIDELPQFVNVVRGELSLVGPRPLLMEYLPLYSPEQSRRHSVLPGITGWAQIHGRNAQSWQRRFELDCWYVDNWSLGLDFRILASTLLPVLRRTSVNAEGDVPMTPFTGGDAVDRVT